MSHRHEVQTKITDIRVAKAALTREKISFRESGRSLHLTSGIYAGTSIDCASGRVISGDTDHTNVSEKDCEILKQKYTAELIRQRTQTEGCTLEEDHYEMISGRNQVVIITQRA
jgi:hypothetical protein